MNAPFTLSVVLLREGEQYVAQCLQYDIAAQGNTIDECRVAFERTFIGQLAIDLVEGREPLCNVPQAPKEYWELWDKADRLGEERPFYVPDEIVARAPKRHLAVRPSGQYKMHTGSGLKFTRAA